MKFKPQHLFYSLAVISLILILFTLNKQLDITVHDTYFVLSYFHYFLAIFALSIATGLAYHLMERIKRPIARSIGIAHFSFITVGLVFSINLYGLIVIHFLTGIIPDIAAIAFDKSMIISFVICPMFLLIGTLLFFYGAIRSFKEK